MGISIDDSDRWRMKHGTDPTSSLGIDIPDVISFEIRSVDETGKNINPVPYQRLTQKDKWKPGAKRYHHWCNQIRLAFALAYPRWAHLVINNAPPLEGCWYVSVQIYFKTKGHGDPDNIAKGINDAMFKTDKFVCGSYIYSFDEDRPRVDVEMLERTRDKNRNPSIPSTIKLRPPKG